VLAGVIFDFHELALATLAISFGLWALLERRTRLFAAMLVLGCLAKEDIALTFAATSSDIPAHWPRRGP
jgi:uncharacterized membrane protein